MRYLYFLLSFIFFQLNAQSLELSGMVMDEQNQPVVGANVFLLGTYDGASTDLEGMFSFSTSEVGQFELVISYLGYEDWKEAVELPQSLSAFIVKLKPVANDYTYIGTSYRTAIGAAWQLQMSAAYTGSLDKMETIASIHSQTSALLSKGRLSRAIGQNHLLRLGVSHWRESFNEQLKVEEYAFQQQQLEPYTAAFAETDWHLHDKLVARTGIRLEYRHPSEEFVVSPRLSLAYKTGQKSQVSLAAGRFTQRPQKSYILERQNLRMEEAWHFITNWQWQKEGRTLRLEAYRKVYDHLVTESVNGLNSNGDGYAQGVDLFFRDKVSIRNSDFWMSYSYLDTERRYGEFPVRIQPSFAAKHTVNLVYKYWIPRWQLLVGLTAVYATPLSYYHDQQL